MSWHERMNQAVDYMENKLCEGIDYDRAAKIAGQSRTSFQRTFSLLTDMSVSEYVRRRRLCLAAYELQCTNEKVIHIAMKYGYESPEAFTRAFKEIYGVSPSEARKDNVRLMYFPRISFQLTIKGDIVMNYENVNSAVRIVNMYCEHLPALRLIGKRYTREDMDADMMFGSKWNEWFQNGWFDYLGSMGCLAGFEYTVIMGFHMAEQQSWWICMFFPSGTEVPDGFSYVDLPEGDVGICWLHADRNEPALFKMSTHDLCKRKLQDAGCTVRVDFNGVPSKWSFERYDNKRFLTADENGKIILDYGTYIVESEASSKMSFDATGLHDSNAPADQEKSTGQSADDVIIPDVAVVPTEYESHSLIAALATVFLKCENYSAATPYFCLRQGNICNHCGNCGDMCDMPDLYKHHRDIYNYLLTVTGVAFMWYDTFDAGGDDLKYMKGITPPLLEDRLDFAMKLKGYEYRNVSKASGEQEVFYQIAEAVQRNIPVILKMSNRETWYVVSGINKAGGELYAADSTPIKDWYQNLQRAVIVVKKSESTLSLDDEIIGRIIARLQAAELDVMEALIPQMLNTVTTDNAYGIAGYMNRLAGYVMTGRWRGAEAFGTTLLVQCQDEQTKAVFEDCRELLYETSEICWEICGELGSGPHTNYELPNLIIQSMQKEEKREKLISLFGKAFANERLTATKLISLRKEE